MLRVGGAAVAACMALVLCACTGESGEGTQAEAETTVLGTATERESRPSPRAAPTSETAVTPQATETGSDPGWVSSPVTETPEPTPTQPPAKAPEPTSPPAGHANDPPEPEVEPGTLSSGPGWSMNTLLPDDDGEGWTEVGGQPPVDAGGTSPERLFAELVHELTQGDPAGRNARCRGWIEVGSDEPLQLHGEVVVELVVGDDAVGRSVHELDVTLAPGQRHDLPAWQRAVRLHAAEGQAVTCSAWFFEVGD